MTEEHGPTARPPDANDNEEEEDLDDEGQDFLFLMEEAYTQDKGEIQLSFVFSFIKGREIEKEFEFMDGEQEINKETSRFTTHDYIAELEYGITDRLQFEVEIPDQVVRESSRDEGTVQNSHLADIELGLGYALLQETATAPAITAGFELTLPTGDATREIGLERVGYAGSLALSKNFGCWVGHLNIGYEYTPGARMIRGDGPDGPQVDLHGFEYAIGGVYKATPDWHILLELAGETEHELNLDHRKWETELFILPGLRYGVETAGLGEVEIGVGFPIGLTSSAPDWGVITQVQWEFGS